MSSSRGFGDLGATKKAKPTPQARAADELDVEEEDLRDDLNEESDNEDKEPDEMTCPNC